MGKRMGSRLGFILCAGILMVVFLAACAKKEMPVEKVKLYTSYTIWLHKNLSNNISINYKNGEDRLPCGTEVKDVQIVRNGSDNVIYAFPRIYFTVAGDGRVLYINYNQRWHPGKTIDDFKNTMISTKPFEVLTEGMTQAEVEAIRKGVVVDGMSKAAVACSYGPPPEHATPSMNDKGWIYWMTKFKKKKVCFNSAGKTVRCSKRDQDIL